jgi:hypothetical protein
VQKAQQSSLEQSLNGATAQLGELTGLRLCNLLSDGEFVAKRRELQQEVIRLERKLTEAKTARDPIEHFREIISFSN